MTMAIVPQSLRRGPHLFTGAQIPIVPDPGSFSNMTGACLARGAAAEVRVSEELCLIERHPRPDFLLGVSGD